MLEICLEKVQLIAVRSATGTVLCNRGMKKHTHHPFPVTLCSLLIEVFDRNVLRLQTGSEFIGYEPFVDRSEPA
jgi:hypothetical protein